MFPVRRVLLKSFVVGLLGIALSGIASAQAPMPVRAGQEFTLLERPQPTTSGKKVEVLEFFGYFCPACNAFEPHFEAWIKKQGDRIVVKRVHTDMHELVTQQKLFFTLEAMGNVEQMQSRVFAAYHVERNRLSSDAEVMKFIDKSGVDKKKFTEIYNSFTVMTKVKSVPGLQAAYRVNSVPTVIIDGRFVVSPSDVANKNRQVSGSVHPGIIVMDALVNKTFQEKNP